MKGKKEVEKILMNKKVKSIALVAPSFVSEFSYPEFVSDLRKLGFDKIVELTFGAKMINREYHEQIKNSKKMLISSACPGIVQSIKNKFPEFEKNLIKIDSPLVATGKICKKFFKEYKTIFISPCHMKKIEVNKTKFIEGVLDYNEIKELFEKYSINLEKKNKKDSFDKFYNDYTKIYPISGGLFKTAHLKGVIKKEEVIVKDGWSNISEIFSDKERLKKIKFMDITFCKGGCIGGPCINSKNIGKNKRKVKKYLKKSRKEDIPENKKGLVEKAKGINFIKKSFD